MKAIVTAAFAMMAMSGAALAPASAQGLPPIGGPYPPTFTATLSNNAPLVFGMDAQDAARALGTPLNYIKGRAGRRSLPGVSRHRRQRIVSAPPPALSAIPRRPAGRLERRLGPQLDVAIADRAAVDLDRHSGIRRRSDHADRAIRPRCNPSRGSLVPLAQQSDSAERLRGDDEVLRTTSSEPALADQHGIAGAAAGCRAAPRCASSPAHRYG